MIRRALYKFVNWINNYGSVQLIGHNESTRSKRRKNAFASDAAVEANIRSNGMSFNLYAAEGGTVIETSFYNDKQDRNENRLYIIPEGENFNDVLGQIVSMERMRSWH